MSFWSFMYLYFWWSNLSKNQREISELLFFMFLTAIWLPLFMDGIQQPQDYRAILRRQFTFYHQVPRKSWYSFDRPQKDQRLSWPWTHPMVLNTRPLVWESSTLTTRPLLHQFPVHDSWSWVIFASCLD